MDGHRGHSNGFIRSPEWLAGPLGHTEFGGELGLQLSLSPQGSCLPLWCVEEVGRMQGRAPDSEAQTREAARPGLVEGAVLRTAPSARPHGESPIQAAGLRRSLSFLPLSAWGTPSVFLR